MPEHFDLTNPIIRGLACAALQPGLQSILLIDATSAVIMRSAAVLKRMLEVTTGLSAIKTERLASSETEDILWGMPFLSGSEGARFILHGRIVGSRAQPQQQLIVVPNIAQLSLAAQRAAVMAVGADVVHLERHGQHLHWQPSICWLAACEQADIGKVSPHLLDRFLLRIWTPTESDRTPDHREMELLTKLNLESAQQAENVALPATVRDALHRARHLQPILDSQASTRIITYVPTSGLYTPRRDIALARLAVAHAMLDASPKVEPRHVDQAAEVMGLRSSIPNTSPVEAKLDSSAELSTETSIRNQDSRSAQPSSSVSTSVAKRDDSVATTPVPVYEPDETQSLPATPLPVGSLTPYVEDEALPQRDAASLRLPLMRSHQAQGARGLAVGVERATDLHDLALASTLFEAAKFQPIRRHRLSSSNERLLLHPHDLRRYRRLPTPERMLVLVIDYTALRHCDWEAALEPHLRWAYTSRASIALIRVGAKNAIHELRADRILGRRLLDPHIIAALESEPGMATPLAHGLDLALQTLQHSLQHGRSTIAQARLLILTDGRGNVPLAASRAEEITQAVNREGIEDALQVAAEIRRLDRLEIVVLDPQPPQYAELPEALAESFGVTLTSTPGLQQRIDSASTDTIEEVL